MKNMLFVLVFCVTSAIAQTNGASTSTPPQLVSVDGFPADALSLFQTLTNEIQPALVEVTTPAAPAPTILQVAPSQDGGDDSTHPALFSPNLTQPSITPAVGMDRWNNRRPSVYGGANTNGGSAFYDNWDNDFDSMATILSLMTDKLGGDYREFDAAINAGLPTTRPELSLRWKVRSRT